MITDVEPFIAAALRAAESEALERAAREAEALSGNYDKDRAEIADSIAARIRALIPLAAAPAEDSALESMCDCGRHVEGEKYALPAGGHVRAAHVDAPAAETGKAQGAEAPDMREALEDLFGAVQNPDLYIEGVSTVTRPLRMAIAKARIALAARAAPPEREGDVDG
jgi:hypothetical protein